MTAKTKVHRTYEWTEYLAEAKRGHKEAEGRHGSDEWAGGTHAQAFKLAREGYHAAVVDAERLAHKVEDTVALDLFQTTFTSSYQVAGAEVDMGRFLSGEPECMIESEPIRISRQGRAVQLAVPVAMVNRIPEETVRRRGAAVLALVDVLSRAQHPMEIWAVLCMGNSSRATARLVYSVRIQKADEPLDIGRVMYFLAHPTVFRRLGFSVMDLEQDEQDRSLFDVGTGYGTFADHDACSIRPEDLPEITGNTIIMPPLWGGERWDDEESIAWVTEQIGRIFND